MATDREPFSAKRFAKQVLGFAFLLLISTVYNLLFEWPVNAWWWAKDGATTLWRIAGESEVPLP